MSSTIFALATPAGRSGVAIIRISGPAAGDVLRAITRRDLPEPRFAASRKFYAAKPVDPSPRPSRARGEGVLVRAPRVTGTDRLIQQREESPSPPPTNV